MAAQPRPKLSPDGMSSRERSDLAQLCRQRERLAKRGIEAHCAALKADFEKKLAAQYSFDQNETWKDAAHSALAAAEKAQKLIADECAKLGIPREFAPGLTVQWYHRGENASAKRRAELRHVADSKIESLAQDAKFAIEKRSLEVQTRLLAGGLHSEEAKAFLNSIPTAEQLMPALNFSDVDKAVPRLGEAGVND